MGSGVEQRTGPAFPAFPPLLPPSPTSEPWSRHPSLGAHPSCRPVPTGSTSALALFYLSVSASTLGSRTVWEVGHCGLWDRGEVTQPL